VVVGEAEVLVEVGMEDKKRGEGIADYLIAQVSRKNNNERRELK
jgi:hypothetical protein